MQSLNDIELDLVWFFQRGEGDCGFSSSQGHFLDVAQLGAWSHSEARDQFENERMVGNVRRYKLIDGRLKALPLIEQTILRAAFDSPEHVFDVAVTLCALTPKAKELYGAAQIRKICKKRTAKTREERGQCRRDWMFSLCERARNGKQANEQLCEILAQARQLRDEAVRAYQEAPKC